MHSLISMMNHSETVCFQKRQMMFTLEAKTKSNHKFFNTIQNEATEMQGNMLGNF